MVEAREFVPDVYPRRPAAGKQGEGLGQTDRAKEKAKEAAAATPSRKSPNTLISRAMAYAKENPVVTNDPKHWFKIGFRDAERAHLAFRPVDEDCGDQNIQNLDAYCAGLEDYKEQCIAKSRNS